MKIDHSSSIPLYKQIEDYVRELIGSGKYDNGKHLPKEKDLANKFGVSRNTVRQGISKLVQEGLLIRTPGKGTIVDNNNITTYLDEWHSFSEEMLDRGVPLKNYSIQVDWEEADSKLAEYFRVKEGVPLLRLERVKGNNEEPFVLFISWFHPRIGLTGNEDFTRKLYDILEEDLSIFPAQSKEQLKALIPNANTAGLLNINQSEPILYRERKVYDAGNRIIEYNECYYRSDKFTYSIDIKRNIE